jgi:hypothetical protein
MITLFALFYDQMRCMFCMIVAMLPLLVREPNPCEIGRVELNERESILRVRPSLQLADNTSLDVERRIVCLPRPIMRHLESELV